MWFWKKNIKPEIPAQKVDEKYKVYLPKLWPYRFIGNLCLLGLIAAISFGIYVAKTNFVEQKLDTFSDYFIDITSKIGFTVDDVIIQGRDKTPLEDIKNIINLANNNNIFLFKAFVCGGKCTGLFAAARGVVLGIEVENNFFADEV